VGVGVGERVGVWVVRELGGQFGVGGVGEGGDDDGFGLTRTYLAWLPRGDIMLVVSIVRERVVFVVAEGVAAAHGRSGATTAPCAAAAPHRARAFMQTRHMSSWVGVGLVGEVLEEGTELGGAEGVEVV
jgi:hypothetical protein